MDVIPKTPNAGFRDRPVWLIGVAALVFAQAGLALALFGPERHWDAVTDDRPILSGRHPLHLYHGTLGAGAFCARGVDCYDPQFQAGYPKTPVFDGGSARRRLFLFLGGGDYRPAAYKLGLFAFLCSFRLRSSPRRGADFQSASRSCLESAASFSAGRSRCGA